MAKVRIKINPKGIADLLKSDGVQKDLARRMAKVKAAAQADPNLPDDIEIQQRDYIGHDRARSSLGIPGHLEAQHGILSRALDAAGD